MSVLLGHHAEIMDYGPAKRVQDPDQKTKPARRLGINAIMARHRLDALVGPTGDPARVTDLVNGDSNTGWSATGAAVAGYPHITVAAGYAHGLPVALSFLGRAWSEPTLIRLAHAFKQATVHR